MTSEAEKELAKFISPKYLKRVLADRRRYIRKLKAIRAFNDKQARKILITQYQKNGNKWKSDAAKEQFKRLMNSRWTIHQDLGKVQAEEKDPEFDSP